LDYPKLITPIFFALLAVLCLLIARFEERLPDWFRMFLVLSGVLFAIVTILSGANWLARNYASRLREIRQAQAITPMSMMLDKLHMMRPDQMELAYQIAAQCEELGGLPEPVSKLLTPYGHVPRSFVYRWANLCDGDNCPPIRSWNDGTYERQYAEALTKTMIRFGFARQSVGNKSAQWIDREQAFRWLGVRDA